MQSLKRILLVEPDDVIRGILEGAAASLAQVESHRRFETARASVIRAPFDFLVTNVRLGAYNGLHLVYLGSTRPEMPRAIVFSQERDAGLGREIQRAGAFYELGAQLPVTLAAYLAATLPRYDRRDPAAPDRRTRLGGGRRCRDLGLNPHADTDFAFEDASDMHPSSM
jgi:DNA-binding NtrC family response regulator